MFADEIQFVHFFFGLFFLLRCNYSVLMLTLPQLNCVIR